MQITNKMTMCNHFCFTLKNVTDNKRGKCINYQPKLLKINLHANWFNVTINKWLTEDYKKLCKSELDYLKYKRCNLLDLIEWKQTHPFWAKETNNGLLQQYNNLYSEIYELGRKEISVSKNIISTQNKTCISLFQKRGNNLFVTSRSCDLSLGFLADLFTISEIAKQIGCTYLFWLINVPHIYYNNYEKHIDYFCNKK